MPFPIKKNEKYATIAAYAVGSCVIVLLLALFIINFSSVRQFFATYSSVFSPFIYAFIIAFLCNPVMMFFEKKLFRFPEKRRILCRCKRGFSITLTLLLLLLLITVLVMMVIPTVSGSYVEFMGQISGYIKSAQNWIDEFIKDSFLFSGKYEGLNDFLNASEISTDLQSLINNFSAYFSKAAAWIINYAGKFVVELKNLLIGIFIAIYFLASKEKLLAQLKKILSAMLPRHTYLNVVSLGRYTNRAFTGFISGKMLDSLIIGLLSFIVLGICKMPYYPLISVIVGVTDFIPVFGPFIGAIPSAFIILIADPPKALWFVIIIIVIQQLDGNVIGPKILGDTTGLSALWVLLAIVIFGGFFGLTGMLLGVPLMAVIYTVISEAIRKRLRRKNCPTETAFYLTDPPQTDFQQHSIFFDSEETTDQLPETSAEPVGEQQPPIPSEPLKNIMHTEIKELLKRRFRRKKTDKPAETEPQETDQQKK